MKPFNYYDLRRLKPRQSSIAFLLSENQRERSKEVFVEI